MHNLTMTTQTPVRIQCLSVLRVKPGMALARALHRPDGAVLMPEGTELDDGKIEQLQQRGIDCLYVRLPESRTPEEIERELAAAEARVRFVFRTGAAGSGAPEMDEMREMLMEAVLAYRRAGWLK
ncbi:MAG: hypothetical protein IPH08_12205 [Rhodocyclaceae bacterium]|jgi:hypothetical protein|nr:hypothetical protein [Rhodocyclaceae bacterium]